MPTRPDIFPFLALKQTHDSALVTLFTQLCDRAETYARLHDEFSEGIVKHREAREGKPFRYLKRQEKMLRGFEEDAEWAARDLEMHVKKMDEVHLLASALLGEQQQLELDERLFPATHPDDKDMAERLLTFRHATIDLIQQTIHNFHRREEVEAVVRLLSPKPKSKTGAPTNRRPGRSRRVRESLEGGGR